MGRWWLGGGDTLAVLPSQGKECIGKSIVDNTWYPRGLQYLVRFSPHSNNNNNNNWDGESRGRNVGGGGNEMEWDRERRGGNVKSVGCVGWDMMGWE